MSDKPTCSAMRGKDPCNLEGKYRIDGKLYCRTCNPHHCVGTLWSGAAFHASTCFANGKVKRDGKWYCGHRDPVAVKTKQVARDAKWKKESDARHAGWAKQEAHQKENARKLAHYPKLLEATKLLLKLVDDPHFSREGAFVEIAFVEGIVEQA